MGTCGYKRTETGDVVSGRKRMGRKLSDVEPEDILVVVPLDVRTRRADDRGRVSIGTKYSDRLVTVAVLEIVGDGDTEVSE